MDMFMRDTDAFSWYMEGDPTLRTTIVSIAWLEHSPEWDTLVSKVERATRLVPIFRQRVVEPPGRLAPPRWTVDEHFDLTLHIRRIDSPVPHTPETVVAFARNAVMTAFDHERPLWEFTLVEGLEGGRAALVMKVHHALTDGVGGMQLAMHLFDLERVPAAPGPGPDPPANERIRTAELVRDSLVHDWNRTSRFVRDQAGALVPTALHTVRHPVASAADAYEAVRSIGRTVAPVTETLSPIMKERSTARHLDLLEARLGDLKRAAACAGGSVNDGFLAAATGGFRHYHERHGTPVDELRVTLPISIRKPDDPPGGNRITLMRFAVPIRETDPASRIAAMGRLCRSARDERSIGYVNSIAATLNLLPRAAVAGMLKHVDFVATDVPGFPFPVYLAGARTERLVAFGPTIGSAVNLALVSYDGMCSIGVSIDTASVPDPELLIECFRVGFEEVLALAGEHAPVRRPITDARCSGT
jgi:WS/DGAT/MGAT family acyltransferase